MVSAAFLTVFASISSFFFPTPLAAEPTYQAAVSTTTMEVGAEIALPKDIQEERVDFENFSFFVPAGWESFTLDSHKGSQLTLSPTGYEDAPYFININVDDPNKYTGGVDEFIENPYRHYLPKPVKIETYVPSLRATSTRFALGTDASSQQNNERIIIFTSRGILSIDIAQVKPKTIPKSVLDSILFGISFSKKVAIPNYLTTSSTPKTYLGSHFSTDNNHVYYYNQVIDNANPKNFSFQVSTSTYGGFNVIGKDEHSVWDMNIRRKVEGADPTSFTLIGEGYARDKNYVYFPMYPPDAVTDTSPQILTKIPGADPESFSLTRGEFGGGSDEEIFGKDKNHTYIIGKITTKARNLRPY